MAALVQVPGATDVDISTRGQTPELAVELDRPLAGSLGVTVGRVAASLRPAFACIDAGDGSTLPVRPATSPCTSLRAPGSAPPI